MLDSIMKRLNKKQRIVFEFFLITIAVALLGIAITVFYQPNDLVTGGVSGIGIMVESITKGRFSVSQINLLLNIPLVLLGLKMRGGEFIVKTLYATIMISVVITLAKYIPAIKDLDDLLASIFGGAISGIGLGIVIRCNSTTGGTDLAAMLLQQKKPHLPVSRIIFILEFIIISLGMFLFGPSKGMYAFIAIYIQTKFMDITLEGLSFAKAAFVVTDQADKMGIAIVEKVGRSATIMDSYGAYRKSKNNVLLCVLPAKKLVEFRKVVAKIDDKAFIIVADVTEVYGEGYKAHFIEPQ